MHNPLERHRLKVALSVRARGFERFNEAGGYDRSSIVDEL